MKELRKLAAILVADVVGYSRLAGADEDRILARLRALRSDLVDPTIAVHHGRVVKRTGDGAIIEFRSAVDAVRCAIEIQNSMIERNAGLPEDRRIEFRVGIHVGDVVQEEDGDLMGDGVNIAARLEGISAPGAICLSEDAYRQVKGRLEVAVTDLGSTQLKNIAGPVRAYSLQVGKPSQTEQLPGKSSQRSKKPSARALLAAGIAALLVAAALGSWHFLSRDRSTTLATAEQPSVGTNASAPEAARLSLVVLPFTNLSNDPSQDYFADGITENLSTDLSRIPSSFVIARNTAFTFKGKNMDVKQIGKELGVRYVLEGSVQRDQNGTDHGGLLRHSVASRTSRSCQLSRRQPPAEQNLSASRIVLMPHSSSPREREGQRRWRSGAGHRSAVPAQPGRFPRYETSTLHRVLVPAVWQVGCEAWDRLGTAPLFNHSLFRWSPPASARMVKR